MFDTVVPFEVTVDVNPEQLCRFDSLKRVVSDSEITCDICWVERTMNLVLLGFKARLESLDHDPSLVSNLFKSHVVDSTSLAFRR